jgi:hypothetical protein
VICALNGAKICDGCMLCQAYDLPDEGEGLSFALILKDKGEENDGD